MKLPNTTHLLWSKLMPRLDAEIRLRNTQDFGLSWRQLARGCGALSRASCPALPRLVNSTVKMAKGDPKKPKGKMCADSFFVQMCREEHKKNPEVPGASVRNSAHGKGHEEGGFSRHKGRIKPQETPFPSICPQNQSLPTLLLYALTYTSDFIGGCPPPPLSEELT